MKKLSCLFSLAFLLLRFPVNLHLARVDIGAQKIVAESNITEGSFDPAMIEIGGGQFTVDTTGQVANYDGIITEFEPNVYMAHSNLAGRYFAGNAKITYANGLSVNYILKEEIILQALDPTSGETSYTDGIYLYNPMDIRERIFKRGIIFMTCYEKDGEASWGRRILIMKRGDK